MTISRGSARQHGPAVVLAQRRIMLLAYDRDVCAQIGKVQERYFRDGE
jgi:hypothetical protein